MKKRISDFRKSEPVNLLLLMTYGYASQVFVKTDLESNIEKRNICLVFNNLVSANCRSLNLAGYTWGEVTKCHEKTTPETCRRGKLEHFRHLRKLAPVAPRFRAKWLVGCPLRLGIEPDCVSEPRTSASGGLR